MNAPSREKIALAVFAALIILSLGGLGAYIFAGHSWNFTASAIDDTIGELDGYTVIIYGGTVEPTLASSELEQDDGSNEQGGATDVATDDSSIDDAATDDSSTDAEADAGAEATADGDAATDSTANDAVTDDAVADDASTSSDSENSLLNSYASSLSSQTGSVDLEALCADYEEKGAKVLFLDLESTSTYREGSILKRGDRRIGVLRASETISQLEIVNYMKSFAQAQVDFTLVITPYMWKVERLSGIDIVICTKDEGIDAIGESNDGTFYVDSPEVGQAGVVLISPSNVVSAKEVSEF